PVVSTTNARSSALISSSIAVEVMGIASLPHSGRLSRRQRILQDLQQQIQQRRARQQRDQVGQRVVVTLELERGRRHAQLLAGPPRRRGGLPYLDDEGLRPPPQLRSVRRIGVLEEWGLVLALVGHQDDLLNTLPLPAQCLQPHTAGGAAASRDADQRPLPVSQ